MQSNQFTRQGNSDTVRQSDFKDWFWNVRFNCFICGAENSWEMIQLKGKSVRGSLYVYKCECGLKAVQILTFKYFRNLSQQVLCWVWVDGQFMMEIDWYRGKSKVNEKFTYDIEKLLKQIEKGTVETTVVDMMLLENERRWRNGVI